MPPLFQLTITAPDRRAFEGQVQSLVAKGVEGSFGVLAHHAPMIAQLAIGEMKVILPNGETRFFAISGGFLEVTWEGVNVLADTAEPAEGIDVARAKAAEARARERLGSGMSDFDQSRAEASLQRALNRLRVVEMVE